MTQLRNYGDYGDYGNYGNYGNYGFTEDGFLATRCSLFATRYSATSRFDLLTARRGVKAHFPAGV